MRPVKRLAIAGAGIRLGRVLGIVLAFGAAWIAPAQAGDLSLLINGKAKHLENPNGTRYNERNWGAGVQYDGDAIAGHWIPFANAAGFNDSNYNPSYYAGVGIMRRFVLAPGLDNLRFDVGGLAFLMRREEFKGDDWFPGALPAASFGTDRVAVNVTYIPKVDPKMVPLWFFQIKIRLAEF